MVKYVSTYPGRLILPGGEEFLPGGDPIDLSKDQVENAAVKQWIADEWIAPAPKKTKKREGLETQAGALELSFSDETTDDELIAAIKEAKASK